MLQSLLPPNRREAPRKKVRGLRRYFRRVLSRARSFRLELDDDRWFDLWHYHPDWCGYGNLGWRMRARHLEALALVFDTCARQLTEFWQPSQVWIWLDRKDASQDAVYVHTPNPNSDDFPVVFRNVEWGVGEVSRYFEALLPGYRFRAGRAGRADGYCIYCPDVGVSGETEEGHHLR